MASQHLLPCPNCSASLTVESTQAGQQTRCPHCDAVIDLPTLRKLRELPLVEADDRSREQQLDYSARSQLALGMALIILGFGTAATFFVLRNRLETEIPPLANEAEFAEYLASAPVDELWQNWNSTVRSTDLEQWTPSPIAQNRKTARLFFGVAVTAILVGIGGIGLVVSSVYRRNAPTRAG